MKLSLRWWWWGKYIFTPTLAHFPTESPSALHSCMLLLLLMMLLNWTGRKINHVIAVTINNTSDKIHVCQIREDTNCRGKSYRPNSDVSDPLESDFWWHNMWLLNFLTLSWNLEGQNSVLKWHFWAVLYLPLVELSIFSPPSFPPHLLFLEETALRRGIGRNYLYVLVLLKLAVCLCSRAREFKMVFHNRVDDYWQAICAPYQVT